MADSDNESEGGGERAGNASANELSPREQDRFLPIANVSRIMKKALPANAKISKDAKETVQECVSEFISFITGEASDKCQREKRKTINGDDLLWAMTTLGFEDYVEPLKVYLQRFREMEGEKSVAVRDKDASAGGASSTGFGNGGGFEQPGGGGGVYGSSSGMGMMMHQGGHVYGSSGFHQQMGTTGSGFGGLGKSGTGYVGPGSNTGRPR
ncbi:nuclear transcription factor Y subunit B-3-like [Juglans microcarpa x Juglans regia]|uniref:nuclear transcription factor Y subunit B-3-like n=1 Tax=Juglans microcarpa x Juglans regia TaxID=2249226 RepID=UPI001B7DC390|nr:nuclear transcription factor Y subunit B-3-like [Juglans microcarpa x Juglans regia]